MKKYLAEQTVWRKRFLNPKWLPMTSTQRAHNMIYPLFCVSVSNPVKVTLNSYLQHCGGLNAIVLMKGLQQMPRGHGTEPWLSMGSPSLGNCQHLWSNSGKLAPHMSGLETYWSRRLAGCIGTAPLTSGTRTIWASDLRHPHARTVSNLTFLFCENYQTKKKKKEQIKKHFGISMWRRRTLSVSKSWLILVSLSLKMCLDFLSNSPFL